MTQIKIIYLFLSISFLLPCCNNSSKEKKKENISIDGETKKNIQIIDLERAIDIQSKPLLLSDIVEEIEYIRPEYPKSLVDIVFGVDINENHLFIQGKERLLLYTREGKFLREIGKYGNGPEEHTGIRSFTIYDTIVSINSNFTNKIQRYNIKGNYLGSTPVSGEVYLIDMIHPDRYALHLHHGSQIDNPYMFISYLVNTKGDTIFLKTTDPDYIKGIITFPSRWYYKDTICMKTCINDTVYSITADTIEPRYVIHLGKYKESPESFKDIRVRESGGTKYILSPFYFETENNLLSYFQLHEKNWFVCYNKNTEEIFSWTDRPKEIDKYGRVFGGPIIENNIDGGIDINSISRILHDGYLSKTMQPRDFIEAFEENKKKNRTILHPEKYKELEQMVQTIDEDENPIIILYKLKQ